MREDIREYARLGLVHHLLYPGCERDPDDHARTLGQFVGRPDIETFDCCLPAGDDRRQRLIPAIRSSGKTDIAYAAHLFPLDRLSFSTPVPREQPEVRAIVKDMVEQAAAIGATSFIFGSGGPAPDDATQAHHAAFADFCRWLCAELKPHGMLALLEPFDTDIDRKFLFGATEDCVALIRSLNPKIDNMAIELDLAHVPLMGETFEHAITTAAPYLHRVHLGNCVLKDPDHPRYGDTHPPIGFDGGEIDVPELTRILACLLEVGFLGKKKRGSLVIEMTPWPGKTPDETAQDSLARLRTAWERI